MKYTLDSESFIAEGPEETLNAIYKELSFKDKTVEYEINKLRNLKRRMSFKAASFDEKITALKLRELVHVAKRLDHGLWIPIGLFPRVSGKYPGEVVDKRNYRLNKRLMRSNNSKLRKPQEEAMAKIRALQPPVVCGVIDLPTATGKTRLAEEVIAAYGLPTIFLVPSRNLMNSTAERFEGLFGKNEVGVYGDGRKNIRHVTVATYQSVNLADLEEFKDVRMAIFDEVHRVPAETFFSAAIVNLKNAIYRIGLSATPDRADGSDLLIEAACGEIIYSYSPKQAIADGFLARPSFIMYAVQKTKGTYKKWKTEKGKRIWNGLEYADAGNKKADTDTLVAYKNWVLGNDYLNDAVALMARDCAALNQCVLILVDEKEHGEKLSERLQGITHEFVHGDRNDVEDVIQRFNRREIPVLIGTTVIGEGTDTIPVDVMFNLLGNTRPKQAIGRALRNENGKKPKTLIIDFYFPNCPVLDRHSKLRQKVYEEYGQVDRENLV